MAAGEGFAAYLDALPEEARDALQALRAVIRDVAPEAIEGISYRIPTFYLRGRPLVYMAAFAGHYSMYPLPAVDEATAALLAPHVAGKGTLRFAYGRPLPEAAVRATVEGLLAALLQRETAKPRRRKGASEATA